MLPPERQRVFRDFSTSGGDHAQRGSRRIDDVPCVDERTGRLIVAKRKHLVRAIHQHVAPHIPFAGTCRRTPRLRSGVATRFHALLVDEPYPAHFLGSQHAAADELVDACAPHAKALGSIFDRQVEHRRLRAIVNTIFLYSILYIKYYIKN